MKQKREITVLLVLLIVAGIVWFLYFQRDKQVVTADAGSSLRNFQLLSVENPHIRVEKLEDARKAEYKSLGRNIFTTIAPPPLVAPAPAAKREHPTVTQPPPPPIPPPPVLPAKFFGYGTVPNGSSRRAFFTDGEDVHIVPEGEVLMNRFRILKINNTNVEFEEISSGRRGTAPLEEQGGPPAP